MSVGGFLGPGVFVKTSGKRRGRVELDFVDHYSWLVFCTFSLWCLL